MRTFFHSAALKQLWVLAFFVLTIPNVAVCQESASHTDRLWYWDTACADGKNIGIKILVEGQVVYHSAFRACHRARTDALTKGQGRPTAFYFSGGHTFQNKYHTAKTDKIEGNIWQAGADPDGIVLGVSFVSNNQVLLNTIHFVDTHKATRSTLDRNVIIKTYPLASSVPSADK